MSTPLYFRDARRWSEERPFCHMVKAGDYLWLSGQTATDEEGKLVGVGDIKAQSRQVFTNVRRLLGLVGCDLTAVIRLTTYLTTPMTDMVFTQQYWEVRREFFGKHLPASTGVQVAALMLPEMLVEVDVVAYAPNAVVHPGPWLLNAQS